MAIINLGPFRIRPRGTYTEGETYRFLDLVSFDGGSYICINNNTIDQDSNRKISPNDPAAEAYWQCIAERGEPGLIEVEHLEMQDINSLDEEAGYEWDFGETDKIYIPEDFSKELSITNVYNGCIGVIITPCQDLKLPHNSDYAVDFNYIKITSPGSQYYLYTFIYFKSAEIGADNGKFIWHRTVINKGDAI